LHVFIVITAVITFSLLDVILLIISTAFILVFLLFLDLLQSADVLSVAVVFVNHLFIII